MAAACNVELCAAESGELEKQLMNGIIRTDYLTSYPRDASTSGGVTSIGGADMSILSFFRRGTKKYLTCVDCGQPKITRKAQSAPRCRDCATIHRTRPVVDGRKVCVKCGVDKPVSDFLKRNKCKKCTYAEQVEKHSKKYVCQNCGKEFTAHRSGFATVPKFCSHACGGFKKGNTPWNAGTEIRYYNCSICGKPKTENREQQFSECFTCHNKKRALHTVYYACPRCGKPKNGRGRSDRVFCNSCASYYKHRGLGHAIKTTYMGFTNELKEAIRKRHDYLCAFCGGRDAKELAVHHVDYNKNNQDQKNLLPLCSSCHAKTNHNREHWKGICQEIIKLIA